MSRFPFVCLGVFFAAVLSPNARADTFNFTFTGSVYAGSGQFTATTTSDYGPNITTYLVTGVTGSATDSANVSSITGIAPLGAGAQANDNLLFYPGVGTNGGDYLDGNGVAFLLSNGVSIVLFAYSGIYEAVPGRGVLQDTGPITVSPVPEPSSLALLAMPGLALLTFQLHRTVRNDRPTTV